MENTKISSGVNRPLIDGLKELVYCIIEEGNERIRLLKTRSKLFHDAEKQGREPSDEERKRVSMITPSPYVDPVNGELEWRFHILHHERDLQQQLKYLRYLADDIRARVANIESNDIVFSDETQERTMKFYIESSEEMGVDINDELLKEWLPREEFEALTSS
jgi:hypothetical protein